jgi:hypothetical protein
LCSNNDILPETLQLFRDSRNRMLGTIEKIRGISGTSNKAARSARNYVESFFRIIDDPEEVRGRMIGNCVAPETAE